MNIKKYLAGIIGPLFVIYPLYAEEPSKKIKYNFGVSLEGSTNMGIGFPTSWVDYLDLEVNMKKGQKPKLALLPELYVNKDLSAYIGPTLGKVNDEAGEEKNVLGLKGGLRYRFLDWKNVKPYGVIEVQGTDGETNYFFGLGIDLK